MNLETAGNSTESTKPDDEVKASRLEHLFNLLESRRS